MGGDMVAALGRATSDGITLFGSNCRRRGGQSLALHRGAGRAHAPEECIETGGGVLPQARETHTAVGVQTRGEWGYHHGVNVHGVAAGCTRLRTRLASPQSGLRGPDIVRLMLERAQTARQALDLATDFIRRHGQGAACSGEIGDNAFLVADAAEAFVLETAGRHWAYQEVRQVRAVSDTCTVRQDWDGVAPGLAGLAIDSGWWPGDGSKVDFAGVAAPTQAADAMRRWGRATFLLEEQNGYIDLSFIRRMLSDHYEGCPDEADPVLSRKGPSPLCLHGNSMDGVATGTSLIVQLGSADPKRIAWFCPGPPCIGVYLPVLLAGDLDEAYGPARTSIYERIGGLILSIGRNRPAWDLAHDCLSRLQARLDQEVEEFAADPAQECEPSEPDRRATLFMRHALERFEETVDGLLTRPRRAAPTETPAAVSH
jgi:secernin